MLDDCRPSHGSGHHHHHHHSSLAASNWKSRLTYRNFTFLICCFNLVIALLLFQAFFDSSNWSFPVIGGGSWGRWKQKSESDAIRYATIPLRLIERVREIQSEDSIELDVSEQGNVPNAASDLSKRLQDSQASNDVNNQKALDEWLKRKSDRAKQRQLEKNASTTTELSS